MSANKLNSLTAAEWIRSSSESSSLTTTPPPPPLSGSNNNVNIRSVGRPGSGAVLSESSNSVSASQVFTKWLKKKSASSSENDSTGHNGPQQPPIGSIVGPGVVVGSRGQLFPARLALALGMAKTLLGVLLVAFGALALWEQASMSYLGSGELSSYSFVFFSSLLRCSLQCYHLDVDERASFFIIFVRE